MKSSTRLGRIGRRGSLIVAVLVVLFLVVMMSTQTFQTLLLVKRNDSRQNSLRQARELVELGRLVLRQRSESSNLETIQLKLGNREIGKIAITPLGAQPVAEHSTGSSEAERGQPLRFRIVATYPAGTGREFIATWEGSE